LIFVLACNFVTQPFSDAQDVVETAQSFATSMPIETLQSLGTALPVQTLEAFPSMMPDLGNAMDPQGAPLSEWNGIPIIPSATAGEETSGLYSFKANATTEEVVNYYKDELAKLGWSEVFNFPDTGSGALLTYEKDNHVAAITVTKVSDNVSLVFVTYQ
jgi:hypothetical protein